MDVIFSFIYCTGDSAAAGASWEVVFRVKNGSLNVGLKEGRISTNLQFKKREKWRVV
jgi:alkaline phosphatase